MKYELFNANKLYAYVPFDIILYIKMLFFNGKFMTFVKGLFLI